MRQRALAEACMHARDLLLGDAGPGVLDAQQLPAGSVAADGRA